ncbi:MAG: pentapeptide repeat-containing protein [Pseudomonadota bacterium]
MGRVVALLVAVMIGILTVSANLAAGTRGEAAVNPLEPMAGAVTDLLNGADRLAPDLARSVENNLNFDNSMLNGALLKKLPTNEILTDGDLAGLEAPGANYTGAEVSRTRFVGALLDEASFDLATGDDPDFSKTRLALASFVRATLPRADFSKSDLRSVRAERAAFENASFRGADITGGAFSEARLKGADFSSAYIAHGWFNRVKADGAEFNGADLRAANFQSADLTGAVFTGADISYARFTGAVLKGADFTVALGAATAWFEGACGDETTKAPDGVMIADCKD